MQRVTIRRSGRCSVEGASRGRTRELIGRLKTHSSVCINERCKLGRMRSTRFGKSGVDVTASLPPDPGAKTRRALSRIPLGVSGHLAARVGGSRQWRRVRRCAAARNEIMRYANGRPVKVNTSTKKRTELVVVIFFFGEAQASVHSSFRIPGLGTCN
jgi:hypothetical protein